jgi:hypothetical protein
MSSQMRYRKGVVKYLSFPTHASYPIEEGDLCWLHSDGKVYPAYAAYAVLGDLGSAAQNRVGFASRFVGVAVKKTGLQAGETSFKLTVDPGYTLVAISGIFEYDSTSQTWAPANLVGIYNDATYNSNQKVDKVTAIGEAIGTAVVAYDSLGDAAQTTVMVDLRPQAAYDQAIAGTSGT